MKIKEKVCKGISTENIPESALLSIHAQAVLEYQLFSFQMKTLEDEINQALELKDFTKVRELLIKYNTIRYQFAEEGITLSEGNHSLTFIFEW
ncbi:IDEAL domain-containing protein [Niallia taxi]|uniref:IDEAL domain-containing protein n=1 Tax=Niallia taxi TaxID=2499688 RepID=UPI0015F3FE89|nr:IDEAL domain-containing protein [Niallia taxi]